MSTAVPFKSLAAGAVFYMDAYPGNIYRKLIDGRNAEFVQHRLGNHLIGCVIYPMPDQLVRKQPLEFDPNDMLSGDDYNLLDGCDLLATDNPEDLLA